MSAFVTVSGWWSTNIGNSFFQIGAEYLLKKAFPDADVRIISDSPGFWNVKKGNHQNAFVHLESVEADYAVVHGPLFRKELDRIYLQSLKKLSKNGTKIIILAAGMMHYSDQAKAYYDEWFKSIPIHLLTSRDNETFESVGKFSRSSLDAIDIAFFISDAIKPARLNLGNYLALNFDQIPEPKFIKGESNALTSVMLSGENYNIVFPKTRTKLYNKFKFFHFAESLVYKPSYPEKIGDYTIIRTDHRFNPYLTSKIYNRANTHAMDVPYGYLSIYANTYATFTNRVHACVATLAYGRQAMLFSKTPRAKLLERAGIYGINKNLCFSDPEYLDTEKAKIISFLREAI